MSISSLSLDALIALQKKLEAEIGDDYADIRNLELREVTLEIYQRNNVAYKKPGRSRAFRHTRW